MLDLKRKEVNAMKYSKPEINELGQAALVIQGQFKNPGDVDNTNDASDCELDD